MMIDASDLYKVTADVEKKKSNQTKAVKRITKLIVILMHGNAYVPCSPYSKVKYWNRGEDK